MNTPNSFEPWTAHGDLVPQSYPYNSQYASESQDEPQQITSLGALFAVTLYTTTFEFEERPETLEFSGLSDGAPTCGTGWTGWAKSGYGMSNPCPKSCYRGLTLRKQLRMSGFPPWPGYRREQPCWNNDD